MRIERIDVTALPERYRKQVLAQILDEQKPKARKYHNEKTEVSGITFDSKKEAVRFYELSNMERAGMITKLKLQPQFTLQEGFKTPEGETVRPIRYVADFSYFDEQGRFVVEDVKGVRTKEYLMKKKMMFEKGFTITEV